jgi:outer membrane protein
VEVGDLPPLDAEQAETQLQTTLSSMTSAREVLMSRQNAIKALITDNFRAWVDTDIHPTDRLAAIPYSPIRSVAFSNALAMRPDLAEARLAVDKTDVAVQFRYNQLFPSLDLVARYGGLGVRNEPTEAAGDAFHFRFNDYSYGVVLSSPLTKTSERNQYRASKAAREVAKIQLRKAEEAIFLQVADWVNRVESRYSQVGSTRKARGFAEAALAAEQKKLQNELTTSFVVLQLQETLTATRMAEVQALADYNKALAQLAFAQGISLQKQNLVLEVK